MDYFLASVNDLFEQELQDVTDGHMVGVAIHNDVNKKHIPIGISYRRRESINWRRNLECFKVTQSKARFNVLDTLTLVVHAVKMSLARWRQE